MKIKELWHISQNKSEIRTNDITDLLPGQIWIKAHYSLISAGTERLVCKGEIPKEIWPEMTVPFMAGSFELPVKYGYSLVGEVIEGPGNWPGKFVHIMHPHQDFIACYPKDVHEIPESVPLKRATLASNLETAVNAVWDSGISLGDEILITGFGILGALTALVSAKIPGVKVFINDPVKERMQLAKELGFRAFTEDQKKEFDIAINASASEQGLQMCIDNVGYEGRIIELSFYGNAQVNLKLGGSFHTKRKRIISSQVSAIPSNKTGQWTYGRRKKLVFELLKNELFDALLTTEVPFSSTPELFQTLRNNIPTAPGIIIKYF